MASRSNKAARSMDSQAGRRSYGAPMGTPMPSTAAGRPKVGPGTRSQIRSAIASDQAAAAAGAKAMAVKRNKRIQNQEPAAGGGPKLNLSAVGAYNTIKEKKARDLETIEKASR